MPVIDELKILVTAEVNKAIADLDKVEKQSTKTGASFQSFAKQIAGYSTGMNLAVSATKAIVTGMFNLAKESLSVASGIERTKMEFSVLLGDINLGSKAFAEMNALAAETPLAIADITGSGKQLLSVGIAASEITDKIRMLGDIAMGDAGKLGQLTSAFAQLKSKGVASMEQINRFTEAGVPIIKELAKNFGIAEADVFKLVSSGKVGFGDVEKALTSLTAEGGLYHDMMKQVAETTAGKWSTAQDNFRVALGRMGEEALPTVNKALDIFNQLMDKGAKHSEAFAAFQKYITQGSTDQVDAAAALRFALEEVARAEGRRVGLNARLAGAGDEAVKDARAVVAALRESAKWQAYNVKVTEEQAEVAASADESAKKAEADRLAAAIKAKSLAEDALKNTQEMDKAYAEWGEEVVALYGASSLLNPILDETTETVEKIRRESDMLTSAWSDWTLQIGDTNIALDDAKNAASSIWDAATGAYEAYQDVVSAGHDAEISALEEKMDQMEENGEDTTAIEKQIKDTKNKYAKEEFESNKLTSLAEIAINTAVEAMKVAAIPFASAAIIAFGAVEAGIVAGQQYVPMAEGGFGTVTKPTLFLAGEAGAEDFAFGPKRKGGLSSGGGTTIIQNIGGSIWSSRQLESMAVSAQAKATRGF